MAYFDIHTHIAPQIDDGAKNDETARAMLRMMERSGIKNIILTPHYNEEEGMTGDAFAAAEHVKKLADEVAGGFNIYPGNEIFYSSNVIRLLHEGKIATLAGSRYVLVEFNYGISADGIHSAVNELCMAGFRPIIAHVERYECLYEKGAADHLAESGAYLQINAGSFTSKNRKKVCFVKKLMKNDLVSFIASDCHSTGMRFPNAGKCIKTLNKRYGNELTQKLLSDNPINIIKNQRF